jgi:hypothetical protein
VIYIVNYTITKFFKGNRECDCHCNGILRLVYYCCGWFSIPCAWAQQDWKKLPATNLTLVQKRVLFSGSKICNPLPSNIKMLYKDIKHFKSALRSYLTEYAFYTIDKYNQVTSQWLWFLYILYCSFFFIYFYPLHMYFWLVLRCPFTVSFTLYMFYCFLLFIMIVYVHISPILWQVLYLIGYIPCMN